MAGWVLAVTRGGNGAVWRLPSTRAARLCPLVQTYDVVAYDAYTLMMSYGTTEIDALGALAPSGPLGDRVRRNLATWEHGRVPSAEAAISVQELWDLLVSTAPEPPSDPAELVKLIVEDREAAEGVPIRVRLDQEESAPAGRRRGRVEKETEMSEEEKKARRARIKDDAVIHMCKDAEGKKYGKDNNPKRPAAKNHARFACYHDGMTVKAAKDAGVTAGDISYDIEHNLITVTEAPVTKHGVQAAAA